MKFDEEIRDISEIRLDPSRKEELRRGIEAGIARAQRKRSTRRFAAAASVAAAAVVLSLGINAYVNRTPLPGDNTPPPVQTEPQQGIPAGLPHHESTLKTIQAYLDGQPGGKKAVAFASSTDVPMQSMVRIGEVTFESGQTSQALLIRDRGIWLVEQMRDAPFRLEDAPVGTLDWDRGAKLVEGELLTVEHENGLLRSFQLEERDTGRVYNIDVHVPYPNGNVKLEPGDRAAAHILPYDPRNEENPRDGWVSNLDGVFYSKDGGGYRNLEGQAAATLDIPRIRVETAPNVPYPEWRQAVEREIQRNMFRHMAKDGVIYLQGLNVVKEEGDIVTLEVLLRMNLGLSFSAEFAHDGDFKRVMTLEKRGGTWQVTAIEWNPYG